MRNDLRAQKSLGQKIGTFVFLLVGFWFLYLTMHDPYSGEWSPPKNFAMVTHRIEFGVKSTFTSAKDAMVDTNASIQSTVNERNDRNDSRIERDTAE
jgi:hypothetical protein